MFLFLIKLREFLKINYQLNKKYMDKICYLLDFSTNIVIDINIFLILHLDKF